MTARLVNEPKAEIMTHSDMINIMGYDFTPTVHQILLVCARRLKIPGVTKLLCLYCMAFQ